MTYDGPFADLHAPPQWKPKLDPETVSELREQLTDEIGARVKGSKMIQVGVFVVRGTPQKYFLGRPTGIEDTPDGPTIVGEGDFRVLVEDVAKYRWVKAEEGTQSIERFYYPDPKALPRRDHDPKRRVPLMFSF